jgi:hypothetical protein
LLVNTLEFLAHGWHLLGDITGCEYRYKVGPEVLYLEPFLNDIVDITKQAHLLHYNGLEWSDISHGVHLVKLHDMLLKLLLDILNVAANSARHINSLPVLDLKLSFVPEL